jgi:hypothetical protein
VLASFIQPYEKARAAIREAAALRGIQLEIGKHGVVEAFLPPDLYFKTHPAWFGMVDGKRALTSGRHPVMFETANADAMAAFEKNLVAWLRGHPEVTTLQIWPPDDCVWSQSPEGEALGDPSDRMARLIRESAAAVKAAGLRTNISFIAYLNYLEPPRDMTFDASTVVEFCPIGRSFAAPLDSPESPRNAAYWRTLKEWVRDFPGEVSHYSYYAKFSWESLPVALPSQIARDVRAWHGAGEVGTNMYTDPRNWLALEVNHLAMARASWDEHFNAERWFDSYLKDRYGAAGPDMKRYLAAVTNVNLHGLIPQSLDRPADAFAPKIAAARDALRDARSDADTDAARALIEKISWQPDYMEAALRLRAALDAKMPKDEVDALRRRVHAIADPHQGDGTFLRGVSFG